MATSKPSGSAGISNTIRGIVRPKVSRYDLVLAAIPVAFLLSGLVGSVVEISIEASVALASVVCLLAIVDGLFLNPPESGAE